MNRNTNQCNQCNKCMYNTSFYMSSVSGEKAPYICQLCNQTTATTEPIHIQVNEYESQPAHEYGFIAAAI